MRMNPHGQSVLSGGDCRLDVPGHCLRRTMVTNVSVYYTHNRNFIDLKQRLCDDRQGDISPSRRFARSRPVRRNTDCLDGRNGPHASAANRWCGRRRTTAAITGRTCLRASWRVAESGWFHPRQQRSYAAYPAENPTSPADFAATVYHLLGVDPHMLIRDRLAGHSRCAKAVQSSLYR
jgi:hypothetical protein